MNKWTLRLAGLTLAAAPLLMVGCQSSSDYDDGYITADMVRADMSPELQTLSMTPEQRKNMHARSLDTTMSQIHEDWDRIWYLNKPIGMSRYPVPNR